MKKEIKLHDNVNPFTLPVEVYRRDYSILRNAAHQSAVYLSRMTGKPYDVAYAYTSRMLNPVTSPVVKDPECKLLVIDKNGDRKVKQMTLGKFLHVVNKRNLRMSPAMNAYVPEEVRESDHSVYIGENVEKRSVFKKAMFRFKNEGDTENFQFMKGAQENKKINNNSYSGACLSQATALYCASSHPSLTSTCRAAASYANASNEKITEGNRHYYSPEVVKSNILAIITSVDLDKIEAAIEHYGMIYPSVDDVMDVITFSSDNYWRSTIHSSLIYKLLSNLTPVELAAVCYVGDYYHMHKYNKQLMEQFLLDIASVESEGDGPNVDGDLKTIDKDMSLLVTILHYPDTGGLPSYILEKERPEVIGLLNATARRLKGTLDKYRLLIEAFFVADTMPSNVFEFPSSRRKAVPVSDTDSTMFTIKHAVTQITGSSKFDVLQNRIVFAMVFVITGVVAHLLGKLSGSMGVQDDKLRILSMKNEFFFSVLIGTTIAKHYGASREAQEGNFLKEPELEVKGVGLRDSKRSAMLNEESKQLIEDMINKVKNGEMIDLKEILISVAKREKEIEASLLRGEFTYTIAARIKTKDAYVNPYSSPYFSYELWEEVFAPTYGHTKPPLYDSFTLPMKAGNKTELEAWISRMENKEQGERLREFLKRHGKTGLNSFYIPAELVEDSGIPQDIVAGIDIRSSIAQNMSSFYVILESFQMMFRTEKNHRLISDFYG